MFESSEQLDANKVLVLFILKKLAELGVKQVTDMYIIEIMLAPGLVSYISAVESLYSMVDIKCIDRNLDSSGVPMYSITSKGIDMYDSLKVLIKGGLKVRYEAYIERNLESIANSINIGSTYYENSQGEFFIRCYIREGTAVTVDITMPVASKKDAVRICESWKKNPGEYCIGLAKTLYENIID